MHRKPGASFRGALLLAILTGLAGISGCGPSGDTEGRVEPSGAVAQASDAEWSWLQETRKDLDRRRAVIAGTGAGSADPKLVRETETLTL